MVYDVDPLQQVGILLGTVAVAHPRRHAGWDVLDVAAQQVVDAGDLMPARMAGLRDMASKEPGDAGDEYLHDEKVFLRGW